MKKKSEKHEKSVVPLFQDFCFFRLFVRVIRENAAQLLLHKKINTQACAPKLLSRHLSDRRVIIVLVIIVIIVV